ncbi:CpaF family protein [Paenibacillus sp. y28]|uniref:CpaF family protein n=1 Tax=Paenibacillus sp. y28 TaxID=3129110 RepID=UPI003018A6C1
MDEQAAVLLREQIRLKLDMTQSESDEVLMERIEADVFDYARLHRLTAGEKHRLVKSIFYSFRGLDVLQPLLEDPEITEIMVNSHKEIFVEKQGAVFRSEVRFESEAKLNDIIQSIVAKVDRVVNESAPIVDARLTDGSRVNVVLPPIALKGPTMTIRKFPEKPLAMADLISWGALTAEAGEVLRTLVEAKYNLFICGGTGSGKTTFLGALCGFIPSDERLITIEDSAELQIQTVDNLVRLETRNANTEGKGEITMRQLIRSSLRMRPNRIIVGEVRGAECLDMLAAMNTGHDGSLSTGHANSPHDMLSRLETMVLSGASLPVEVVRKQIYSAIDLIVHVSRFRDRSRKVTAICELADMRDGEIVLKPLFEFQEEGTAPDGFVLGRLKQTEHRLVRVQKLQMAGLRLPNQASAAGERRDGG